MGVRDRLNDNPALTTAVSLAVIGVLLAYIFYTAWPAARTISTGIPERAYYSDDLGQTWRVDDRAAVYGGDAPVRVAVYRFEGGEPFAAYLEKVAPERAERFRQQSADAGSAGAAFLFEGDLSGLLVSRVGEDDWHEVASAEGQAIARTPRENGEYARPVYPE